MAAPILSAAALWCWPMFEFPNALPEDKDFLLEFEPRVVHYEVVGMGQKSHP